MADDTLPPAQAANLFQPGEDARRGNGPPPGSGGRPPSLVRAASREAYEKRIHILEAIADGKALPFVKRVKLRDDKVTKLPDGTKVDPAQAQVLKAQGAEYLEVKWEESADIDQRIKAIDKLGSFGGMNATSVLDDQGNAMKPVYTVGFD